MTEPLLVLDRLAVRYGPTPALRGVSLAVAAGEAVALLGANGAGKTTLLRAVAGLVRPEAGTMRFGGAPLDGLPPDRRARGGIGTCPEGRRVFPGLTVRENLLVACWAGRPERTRRLDEMFTLFPPLRDRADARAWQLSGGQQQMVAVARALMNRPRLLLLDEPSLGLSPALAAAVLGQVPALAGSGTAVLLAESNPAAALKACTRGVVLAGGCVVAEGPAMELAGSGVVRRALL